MDRPSSADQTSPARPATNSSARHEFLLAAVRAARHRARVTQRELARRLGRVPSFIAKIETGQRQLHVLELWELADGLGIDPRALFSEIVQAGQVVTKSTSQTPQSGPTCAN